MRTVIDPQLLPNQPRLGPLSLKILFLVFSGFVFVGSFAQTLNLAWGLWFSEVFVFLGIVVVAQRVLGSPAVRLERPTWRLLVGGFVIGAVNYLAWAVPLMALAQSLFSKDFVDRFDSSVIFKNQNLVEMALIIGGVSLAAPFCEEFFFRGVLQRGLTQWVGPARGIFLTALIFSTMHFDPVGFMARLELGALFGLLLWRTGSLWPGVLAHAANNLISTIAFLLSQKPEGPGEEGDLQWYVPVTMWVLGNGALLALWRLAPRADVLAESDLPRAPASVFDSARSWVLAAGVSVGALLAFDFRGVRLNLFDAVHPASKAAAESLKPLRARARAGETDLADYFSERKAARDKGQ